jgi:hypothetical protein
MVDPKKPEQGFAKVCYYELLEVDRKADSKTIKKVSYLTLNAFSRLIIKRH